MKCFQFAFLLVLPVFAVERILHPAVNVCKRNDPNIKECYCENVRTMIPVIKDGVPEMNIPATDPLSVDNIEFNLAQMRSMQLVANLFNISMHGLADVKVPNCDFKLVATGLEAQIDFHAALITIESLYKVAGAFSLLKLNTTGDLTAQFSDVTMKTFWTSTLYTRMGKELLNLSLEFRDTEVGHIDLHINKLLEDDNKISEILNNAIADNMDLLYAEAKPIVIDTIKAVSMKIVDQACQVLSFDVLFPLE